ncbi:MAG TPA: rRNA maturation RNase YbeY, partial [Patescibacteria group bacterium]|nr:rRNA maturation RNase YbeY [Patescibacteria group bacterium]
RPTDVLSFPAEEPGDFLGEVIINYQQVSRQAPDFDSSPREELVFILVHGLLHLLGYTDDTEETKREMIELGQKLIRELNISL